ncbi:MAG TPA: phosphatidylglycerophosphatase A [Pyrinomonadaceae bacterium]|nr:phosphatidylglycerophosphatase A [Pyrinomonadaceae bacterium]
MEGTVEKRKASGLVDYGALALTTFGVGYIPGAPGTYGSAVGILILALVTGIEARIALSYSYLWEHGNYSVSHAFSVYDAKAVTWGANAILLTAFCLVGIWASGRAAPFFGRKDPSQAVVDEVMGQLITFCFVPVGLGWPFILAGFLLFRLFDIWKPFPVRTLEVLPDGLGICADDIVAGIYAGLCLTVGYTVYLFL